MAPPPRFYIPAETLAGEVIDLPPSEAGHAQVRRLEPGDRVSLFDAQGGEAEAIIETRRPKLVRVRVVERPKPLPRPRIPVTLLVGLIRWERFRLVVEKATELGAERIRPVLTEYAQTGPAAKARDKGRAVVIETLKQCRRSWGPEVTEPIGFDRALEAADGDSLALVLSQAGDGLGPILAQAEPDRPVAILIGPEGGLTEAEFGRALAAGFEPAGLGPAILRTETAALTALAAVRTMWGD